MTWIELFSAAVAATFSMAIGMVRRRKTSAEEATRNPLRRSLLEWIARQPGVRVRELWRRVGMARGTIQYHLMILERIGAVKSFTGEGARRYFPPDLPDGELASLALLRRGRVLDVVHSIREHPGLTQQELTSQLHLSRRVFREYADRLLEEALLDEIHEAKTRRYFPTPRLQSVLADLERAPPGDPSPTGGEAP